MIAKRTMPIPVNAICQLVRPPISGMCRQGEIAYRSGARSTTAASRPRCMQSS
jgi:hypothetical protein